jgi:hypothetical protein
MTKTLHFKSKEGYRKWTAYGHIHSKRGLLVRGRKGRKAIMAGHRGAYPRVVIHGHIHKVKHHR